MRGMKYNLSLTMPNTNTLTFNNLDRDNIKQKIKHFIKSYYGMEFEVKDHHIYNLYKRHDKVNKFLRHIARLSRDGMVSYSY